MRNKHTTEYWTPQAVASRFWSKVNKTDGCWEWTGCRDRKGYGRFVARPRPFADRSMTAYRFSYELAYGPIATDLFVCHRCDNPACVRPDHLFLGTCGDNLHDAATKGRMNQARKGKPNPNQTGEKHPRHKLTDESVRAIRSRYAIGGCTMQGLADEYGVSKHLILLVLHNKIWRHI